MKRLFVLLLSGVVLASSIPSSSYAAINKTANVVAPQVIKAEDQKGSTTNPTNQGLEAAILAIKEKITIPTEYSQFNYFFYNTNSLGNSYWSLTWTVPNTGAYIQVNCDQNNHIVSYNQYSQKSTGIAKYLKSELKATAEAFIKKIAPEVSDSLEYLEANYEGIYSNNYVYSYQRKNNGIAFPDNKVTVSINSVSGEVSSANIQWLYNVTVPSSSVKLTKEEAAKLIKSKMKMKLVYRTDYIGIYDKGIYTTSKKAFLVYEPTESYISVDAKTGKVYLTKSEWVDTTAKEEAAKSANDSVATASGSVRQQLTEEEIAKIEELKGLISKDKAIKTITSNTSLYLDKNLKSYSAYLSKTQDSKGATAYIWNINLNDPREIDPTKSSDTYRAYASASVDAKTGKILSFYASVKSYYDEKTQSYKSVKVPYNKKESKAILEKFLKAQIKDRFGKSKLVSTNDDYIAYYREKTPVYGGYSYQYNRVNEGIEYPYNGIYASVDGITGKIYSYGSNWDDAIVFESPKGVISADKAMEYYLNKDGFDLKYEINVINEYSSTKTKEIVSTDNYAVKYEIRLVYRPDVNPNWISPFTGEQLGADGKVYTKIKPYVYSDIEINEANKNILMLADMGVGFEGGAFLPQKAITIGELNALLNKVGYGYFTTGVETNNDQPITKEEIAYTLIKKLGLEKVANLSGIYRTGYADESEISPKYYGAVALAKGLGLISGDTNNNFGPKKQVTRFEAVTIIMNYINASKESMYN